VYDVDIQTGEFTRNRSSAVERRSRHFELMGNNPVFTGTGMKFECDDMNFVAARHEASRELPGPIFQAATRGIESFEDEPVFHSDAARR
jgi:hypothetical protein